jgi:hypothetical protein
MRARMSGRPLAAGGLSAAFCHRNSPKMTLSRSRTAQPRTAVLRSSGKQRHVFNLTNCVSPSGNSHLTGGGIHCGDVLVVGNS